MFGESSRTASLAGAVTGRPGELSSITFNPGGLADIDRPTLSLGVHGGRTELFFQRDGEVKTPMKRAIAGWGAAIGTPMFGPRWLRALRLGFALHVPMQHALRLVAPARSDQPIFPLYGARAERTAVAAAAAIRLFDRLGIGAGFTLAPFLTTPTVVGFDAARGETPQEGVVIDLERELVIQAAPTFGVRAQAHEWVGLGMAYRHRIATAASGPNDTRAGPLVVNDEIDFIDFIEPDELAGGIAITPDRRWSASLDVIYARWSRFRTIHNREPDPRFEDVFNVRLGLEHSPVKSVAMRLGYAFEPSPVRAQHAESNLLDGHRHVVALGAGWDLARWAPIRFDAHVSGHILHTRGATKDPALLGDADPEARGQQIDNLGYPGFRAGGGVWQLGLTATFALWPRSVDPPSAARPREPGSGGER